MFESIIDCTSFYSYEENQLLSQVDNDDYSSCTVLLSINSPPRHSSEIIIPLNFVLDRELEMRNRGSDGCSYVMQRVQDWKTKKYVPHITHCGIFNEILVDVNIDIASTDKSFVPNRPIDVIRRFYETGAFEISNDLTCDEILYLKSALDKLNLLIDNKCMRYESFSSSLSWSIWSSYLVLRDSIGRWISNQVSIIQATRHSQRIVAFLTSAQDRKVRYFLGDQECMIIDAISDRNDFDFAASKRVIHNCLSEDHLDNCAKDNSNSYSHFIRENLVQFLKSNLSNVKSVHYVFQKSITMYATEHPVSFKQISRPVLFIEVKPSSFTRSSTSKEYGMKCTSIDEMNSKWLNDVLTGF